MKWRDMTEEQKQKVREKQTRWRTKHAEHRRKYQQTWFKSRPGYMTNSHNKYVTKNYRNWLLKCLCTAKNRSRKTALPLDIDLDYLLNLYEIQHGKCALTGMDMLFEMKDMRSISIDRIDQNLGYLKDNVQLVCCWVNWAKMQHTNELFKDVIKEFKLQILRQIKNKYDLVPKG